MDSNRDPGPFLLFLLALIVAVMLFVSAITAPPSYSYSETCIALVGCNRTP
jgi:hypothetical protein